ncbi:ATP-binding cassette domain-containing protein [Myxococcota bacterium]|nr:ATP-binding cassette domain-containing protein [Myxococcota bacterium]
MNLSTTTLGFARALGFAWAGQPALLQDLDLHLAPGWTGLVGANGSGKSTLLRLLAGELAPTAGHVRMPAPVHLCPQDVGDLDEAVRRFSWCALGEADWQWQDRLGLDPGEVARWSTLSPGERKRWQLGAALACGARTLLLDEPSNHLDAEGRARVVAALATFPGVGVLVSHDRGLLDALCVQTVALADGRARSFPGPYGAARRAWAVEDEGRRAEAERLAAQARRAARALHQARQESEAATRSLQVGRRMKGPRDSDARSVGAKFRAERAQAGRGRAVTVARGEAERAQARAQAAAPPARELGRALFVQDARAPREILLARTGRPVEVGGRVLLPDLHLALRRGEHVHLSGPNGAGKSTLMAALLADAGLPPERVLHLPQELAPARVRADLERLRDLPGEERGRVLQLVAALGVPAGQLLATSAPSPGEARKLALALGLGRQVWLAALDEPTNHLDLPSIERLQAALEAFPGALLLITHDEALAAACTTCRWCLP